MARVSTFRESMSMLLRLPVIGPVAVIAIDLAVEPAALISIAHFEMIDIVKPVPRHVSHQAVAAVQIPALKLPILTQPAREDPCLAVHVLAMHDVRPVFDLVCRGICCAHQKQAGADDQ